MTDHIAFLGLGRMGQGMAARLNSAGFPLKVWNRTRAKAEPLLAAGAQWAPSPADATRGARAVMVILADDAASEAVWLGRDGALAAAAPGALAVEFSTLSAAHVSALARSARAKGLAYLDCPVTGIPSSAAAGELHLLVGADAADLARARPLLAPLCSAIHHFGSVGTGTAYKLMINLMGAVQIAALAEGVALAERLGLDKAALIAALETSAAASRQVKRYTRPMVERAYAEAPSFTTALRHKDASYGLALAEVAGSATPLGAAAAEWFQRAMAIDADGDEALVLEAVLKAGQSGR